MQSRRALESAGRKGMLAVEPCHIGSASTQGAAATTAFACDKRVLVLQVLEAGASAVALVRSPKTSQALQELHSKHGDALTIVAMDVGVFSSIQVRAQPCGQPCGCVACVMYADCTQILPVPASCC